MRNSKSKLIVVVTSVVLVAGCQRSEPDGPSAAATVRTPDPESAAPPAAGLPRTAAPHEAKVYFIEPADGATLPSPVSIEFGVENVAIVAAGNDTPASGHHHLIVDVGLPASRLPIPADANHIHFGDGSTSTTLELAPGQHKLTLLLGDHLHIPHDPPICSDTITVTITE